MKKIDDALGTALGDAPNIPDPEPAIPPPTAPSRGSVGERLAELARRLVDVVGVAEAGPRSEA